MNLTTFVLTMLLAGPSPVGFQTAAHAPVDPSIPPSAPYRIGPEDEINLVVVGEDQFTHIFRVQADGGISLPLVGTVMAQGLTSLELQEKIRAALTKEYFRNPQVRAEVSKYGSQFVMVQGEVRDPQRVPMTGPMTVMEALVAAGSETPNAGTRATIARKNPNGTGDALTINVNLADLKRGVANVNVALVGGDIITVGKAETFYVSGRVKSVGTYTWEPGLTVDQAITKAGGVDDRGKKNGIRVTRTVSGKSRVIDVKLTDPVLPNDTIIVPQRMF